MARNPNGGGATNSSQREEATRKVPSKDHKNKDDLSEEDLALKKQLESYVERVQDPDPGLQKVAIESMRQEIRTTRRSLTSVPKPLKFLRSHYGTLKGYYETMTDSDLKKYLADILSVLAPTMSAEGEGECLKYRLLGSKGDICSWGHEYIRSLEGEIHQEYKKPERQEGALDDLIELVQEIVAFHMKHNAEPEAIDLLLEVERLDLLDLHVDSTNFERARIYLTSSANYLPGSDGILILENAYILCINFGAYTDALQIALFLDNLEYVRDVYESCDNLQLKKQFSYILARHGTRFELDEKMCADDDHREGLQDIINNSKLSEGYLTLARDIEVMEPKSPEDIYKTHLLDRRARASAGACNQSVRQNLAGTFVNAFVNAGFGQDKLMTVPPDASSGASSGNWLFKNKEDGRMSAAASLGMIWLWDVDAGLSRIHKFLHSNDNHVIAGALLGVGIVNCSIKHDCDPALALLIEYVDKEDASTRIGAIMGLGIAYAGTQNEQLRQKLTPILNDSRASLDVIAFTSLSLGLIYLGSANEEVTKAIVLAVMDRTESELGDALGRLLSLSFGLLYFGKQEKVDDLAEVSETLNEKIKEYCDMTLISCANAGTGNVWKVLDLLGHCSQHLEEGEASQGAAVLGIAMVAIAEELDVEMTIRLLEHLLQYGEQNIRRAVPLALGLLCISNPKGCVVDMLSRLSHDTDSEVAMAAVISFGFIGAGTNNGRIAGMLRNLSSYYYRDTNLLFCVRIAQGLVHLGKGLLTLNPYHSNRFLLAPTALAGLIITLHACLDMKAIILGKYHYVLYYLVLAMQPRMLLTVDENLEPLSVPVLVGRAVDVVGHVGRPKTITGFQTHSTPVLLAAGDRAVLATNKYIPLSPILEGFVVLQEDPEYRK